MPPQQQPFPTHCGNTLLASFDADTGHLQVNLVRRSDGEEAILVDLTIDDDRVFQGEHPGQRPVPPVRNGAAAFRGKVRGWIRTELPALSILVIEIDPAAAQQIQATGPWSVQKGLGLCPVAVLIPMETNGMYEEVDDPPEVEVAFHPTTGVSITPVLAQGAIEA